ncbi:hypothetical protein [Motiliproteus sp. SC1-56]|uniref:hypothetical protein n=1 Tax=Motiliproteus sp. SC1-56 TaxID=2799565 RepID=UPI001A8FB9FF|nr:hypothetical protein [Motiliproteus sp. SC1-56]
MKREYFRRDVWDKIKNHLTPEKVEAAGFKVFGMKITPQLADKIYDYIWKEKIYTHMQSRKNRRSVKFLYTPNFSVKIYIKDNGNYSTCLIDLGTPGAIIGESGRKEYEDKKKRSLTMIEIYFAILRKYPQHLLSISCATEDELPW